MSNVLGPYHGYYATVDIDYEGHILFGHVLNLRDVINFRATEVAEIESAFQRAVDGYLALCAQRGETAEKPFSGKLLFRTTPEHHRKIFLAAQLAELSLTAWMDDVLLAAAEHALQDSQRTPRAAMGIVTIPENPPRTDGSLKYAFLATRAADAAKVTWPGNAPAVTDPYVYTHSAIRPSMVDAMGMVVDEAVALGGPVSAAEEEKVKHGLLTAFTMLGEAAAHMGDAVDMRSVDMHTRTVDEHMR